MSRLKRGVEYKKKLRFPVEGCVPICIEMYQCTNNMYQCTNNVYQCTSVPPIYVPVYQYVPSTKFGRMVELSPLCLFGRECLTRFVSTVYKSKV